MIGITGFVWLHCHLLMFGSRNHKNRKNSNTNVITTFDLTSNDSVRMNHTMIDEFHMNLALEEAEMAYQRDEVPIGAIVTIPITQNAYNEESSSDSPSIRQFRIIGNAHNLVETNRDASAHAEMLAMRLAGKHPTQNNWRLLNATLYSTLEPCLMCLAAAQSFRVGRIVYAAPDLRLGAIETHIKLLEIAKHPYHDEMEVCRIGGSCEEKSADLMRKFFRERRVQGNKKYSNLKEKRRLALFQWLRKA